MPRAQVVAAVLVGASIALSVASVSAQGPSFSFEWNAPPTCPASGEVLARAERLMGHALAASGGAEPVQLVATVQELADASWQLRMTSRAPGASSRTVSAGSCDELGDAAALLIALSVDPDYAARLASPQTSDARRPDPATPSTSKGQPPKPAKNGAEAESPEPSPRVIGERGPPSARRSSSKVAVAMLGAFWLGRLPGTAPGALVEGALSLERWVICADLAFFPAQHVEKQGLGGELSLGMAQGSLGYALMSGAVTPFVGIELDLMHGRGTDIRNPDSGYSLLLGLVAGLRFTYPLRERVGLLAIAQLSVLPERPSFTLDPVGDLYRPDTLGTLLGLGVELRLR